MHYYFTFGLRGQLYEGGWVRIQANSLTEAQAKFKARYGPLAKRGAFLNYAFHYHEDDMRFTKMYQKGNWGAYEHDYIP